ncbi:DNA ligase [Dissostichus eleginoides]|uniref:DNA ligase n=1 Tax=Dissostichus eleginoides TaxID=100907 RepID=A0AAD9CSK0_DISEL|nr:DNA ligase [Dissostichus eleginoides]
MDYKPAFRFQAGSSELTTSTSSSSSATTSSSAVSSPPKQRRKRKAVDLSSSEDEDHHLMGEAALVAPPPQLLLPAAWRSCLPAEQHEWVSRALFVADRAGRPVLSPELQLLHHPPGPRLVYSQRPSSPDAFFQRPFFLWAPYKMWKYHLKCPNCAHKLTGSGIYKTVRRVLDLDGWYYMGTEYLECRSCTKKCASWSESIRSQLDLDHQQLFPAVLTYRLSCDRRVLALMKGRTLGNSASRLHSFLVEQHTAEWMRRSIHYLHTCRRFEVAGVQMPRPQPPPQMVPVPSSGWLLSTYARESFTRIEELNAKVTSTFGSILKMGSTKKVRNKLAGADAGTTLWMSSVGNELGQVLMSVLTAAEGYGLRDMARGPAGPIPAGREGASTAALFPAWPHLAVRLDICHFMRRLAAGVTSKSHPLYPEFMRPLSGCIFEWDAEDLSLLETALQADGSRRTPSSKEMARHCRRCTRGAQETERLLGETVQAFMGATDATNTPLLERSRMEEILETQRHHIPCIQDPAAVHPGLLCEGGLLPDVPVGGAHEVERGPGGGVAAGGAGTSCYSGQEQYTLHQLTQQFFQTTLVESYVKPLQYTGELIGTSYLYNQTGKVLQPLPDDPDEPGDSKETAGEAGGGSSEGGESETQSPVSDQVLLLWAQKNKGDGAQTPGEAQRGENPPCVCPGCSKDISVIEHLSLQGLTFCRATSGVTLDQWLKVNVPKTTGWRMQIKMASAAAAVFPTRRDRTCTLCSQRTTRATGHSMHGPTRQSFCQVADPQERTVEQGLTELRGGKTEKEMLRDRQRVNRKKKKKPAILNKMSS